MIEYFKRVTVFTLSLFYFIIGIKHFTDVNFFISIMPPYIPYHKFFIYLSGFFEILFGLLLLFRKTRKFAGIGLIYLLVFVFPANIHLYLSDTAQKALSITQNDALIRLPFQLPLMIIAFWHSEEKSTKSFNIFCSLVFIPTILYFLSLGF